MNETLTDQDLEEFRLQTIATPEMLASMPFSRRHLIQSLKRSVEELKHAREVIREMISHGEFPLYSLDDVRACAASAERGVMPLSDTEAKSILRALGESIE